MDKGQEGRCVAARLWAALWSELASGEMLGEGEMEVR